MLRHYLLVALRGFTRHKLYSFINIAGLSVGLLAAILILLYVRDQLSYDTWIPGTEHLYRLERGPRTEGQGIPRSAQCPFPVLRAVGEEVAGVKAVTHMALELMTVHSENRSFHETVTVVDPDFFQVIRLPLIEGDPARALAQPESIVLSQKVAQKLFGSSDPIGKTVTVNLDHNKSCEANDAACLDASYPLTVTGVLRDLPHNTQLLADVVLPNTSRADALSAKDKESAGAWMANNGDYGYVELLPGARPQTVAAAVDPLLDRSVDLTKWGMHKRASEVDRYYMTPFRDVHLTSDQYGGMTPAGSWTVVYGLLAIALLIVLVAGCNFMNLATARAALRAREIGVRKLEGAKRRQLMVQFLGEALLTAFTSLVIALSLVEVLLPAYGRFLHEPMSLRYLADWRLLTALVAGTAVVALLSGLYPALVISAWRPAEALKPGGGAGSGSGWLRSALVVVQFAVSIGLAIAAIVVLRQIDFVRHVDLGVRRDGIVVVRGMARLTPSQRESFANELRSFPGIEGVAYSAGVPFDLYGFYASLQIPGKPAFNAELLNMSPEFPALYGMRLVAGRLLSAHRGEDASTLARVGNLVINESAARRFGLSPAGAIGRAITGIGAAPSQVVGVVADANLKGVQDPLEPMVFIFDPSDAGFMTDMSVRIRSNRIRQSLAFIDATWRKFQPGSVIQRTFLVDTFDDFFRSADREAEMLGIFVVIAIFIACLGLFGLAAFTAERRTKEIGVRKVSGARTGEILRLMLWRISLPVLAANLIAWPVAYFCLHRWLEGYAYRVPLNPLYFLAAGAAALLIAWATVYTITLRLARTNPIHALRYE
ncbi:MAG TPA: ABC transporter permease [Steroidobacteraceae bacterium]|nr:ABC transporter permease [Steroidobacteraceae bacterium]